MRMERVLKSRDKNDVLILRPEGKSLLRTDGNWAKPSRPITVAELNEDWIEIEDAAEESKVLKEAAEAMPLPL